MTFKTHFKLFNNKKKIKNLKRIFLKNIIIFLFSTKMFLQKCKFNFIFLKKNFFKINLLKSPVRHKKFFNQVVNNYFLLKFFFYIDLTDFLLYENIFIFYNFLKKKLKNIGTNLLTRKKLSLIFFSKKNNFFLI